MTQFFGKKRSKTCAIVWRYVICSLLVCSTKV